MANQGITRIEFNDKGIQDLFQCEGLKAEIEKNTDRICEEANANGNCDGFIGHVEMGRIGRWVGLIRASDKKSLQAAAEDKALERALHS